MISKFVVIFLLVSTPRLADGNDKVKSITVKQGDVVRRIEHYDDRSNLIFKKEIDDTDISIKAKFYDADNRNSSTLFVRTGFGFSTHSYTYDDRGNQTNIYITDGPEEMSEESLRSLSDFLTTCMNLTDVLKHPAFAQFKTEGTTYLFETSKWDVKNNNLQSISFEENGDTSSVINYVFNSNNKNTRAEIYHHFRSEKKTSEYDYDGNGNQIAMRYYDGSGTLYETNRLQYDNEQNVVRSLTLHDADTAFMIVNEYKDSLLVSSKQFMRGKDLVSTTTFRYKRGLLVGETTIRLQNDSKVNLTYSYEFY